MLRNFSRAKNFGTSLRSVRSNTSLTKYFSHAKYFVKLHETFLKFLEPFKIAKRTIAIEREQCGAASRSEVIARAASHDRRGVSSRAGGNDVTQEVVCESSARSRTSSTRKFRGDIDLAPTWSYQYCIAIAWELRAIDRSFRNDRSIDRSIDRSVGWRRQICLIRSCWMSVYSSNTLFKKKFKINFFF